MIDLEAERQEAQERRESRDHIGRVVHQAGKLRRECTAATLEEGAMELWPDMSEWGRAEIVEKAREQLLEREMAKKKNVMTGQEMVREGAKIFAKHPDFTAREVYARLEEGHAKLGISLNSWLGAYGSEARRLAGVTAPSGPRSMSPKNAAARDATLAKHAAETNGAGPETVAADDETIPALDETPVDHPQRPDAPPEDKEASDEVASEAERPGEAMEAEAGASPAEPAASPAAAPERNPFTPGPSSVGQLFESLFGRSDRVSLRIGEQVVEATRREDGSWDLGFRGVVTSHELDAFMRHIWAVTEGRAA